MISVWLEYPRDKDASKIFTSFVRGEGEGAGRGGGKGEEIIIFP